MKSLTKLWGEFRHVPVDVSRLLITSRLFLRRLEDPDGSGPPLYVAVNALSGAVDVLSEQEGRFLERLSRRNPPFGDDEARDGLVRQLRDRGYLFPSPEVEELAYGSVINRYKHLKYSEDKVVAFFAIDTACPMKCKYCFEKKNEGESDKFECSVMTPESLEAAFNALGLLCDFQEKSVSFVAGWGGEPLQEKHHALNERFMALAKERTLPISFFSSLATVGPKLFKLLESYAPDIKFVSTTLDATESQHDGLRQIRGAFNRTVAAINTCLRMGISVGVRTNVGPHNMDGVADLAAFYESQGWFDFPNFKGILTRTYDRHHDYEEPLTFTDDEALSRWLRLRETFPLVKKMETIKLAPSLAYIMKAFWPGELGDFRENEYGVKPLLTYCLSANRAEYVFTGAPSYSMYACAECTGLPRFRVGHYLPTFSYDPQRKAMWAIADDFYALRSVDRLDECRSCRAALLCGGYCALEAIVDHGTADRVFCKRAPNVICNFIDNESARLYRRSRALWDAA